MFSVPVCIFSHHNHFILSRKSIQNSNIPKTYRHNIEMRFIIWLWPKTYSTDSSCQKIQPNRSTQNFWHFFFWCNIDTKTYPLSKERKVVTIIICFHFRCRDITIVPEMITILTVAALIYLTVSFFLCFFFFLKIYW